jgi:hypothetical protein
MRKTFVVSAFLFALGAVSLAAAPVITSISPTSIEVNSGEYFIEVNGSGFSNFLDTSVLYSGPAGDFQVYPSTISATHMDVWVPQEIVQTIGTYSVTVRYDDGVNPPQDSNSVTLEIVPGAGPVIHAPDSVTAEATSASGAIVNYSVTVTDDNDPNPSLNCYPASGSLFPIGETTVDCVAEDMDGHATSDSFSVFVVDTTAPSFVSLTATPNVLFPVNNKLVNVTVSAVVSDAVDASPATQIVSVTANQAIDPGDAVITGPMTLQLRAKNRGRVYTITVQSVDDYGNTSTATVDVTVGH